MTDRLRVLLVTSWNTPCGIADHSAQLKAAVEAADPLIEVEPSAAALDPGQGGLLLSTTTPTIVHLNHHDALHSRWTPAHVRMVREQIKAPVVVTYHDTRGTLAQTPKLAALVDVASAVVVHEPVSGLTEDGILLGTSAAPYRGLAYYWRQGVPAPAVSPACYAYAEQGAQVWFDGESEFPNAIRRCQYPLWKAFPQQPVLGTAGFNFPWKNFDRLAQVTGEEGWAFLLCCNNATDEDEARWKVLNHATLVVRGFLPTPTIVNYLAGCDATAWMYECANTGTSGAIRLGIAARKPVIALQTCRQFRDLYNQSPGSGLTWVESWKSFRDELAHVYPGAWKPYVSLLARLDSWTTLGRKYATLYRSLTP